ncbi:MAG: hypothetical protein K0S95_763 [Pantoea eucrina]|jgi:hypothetical protein|nr:hypothetical protein [Pantoea eucrina]
MATRITGIRDNKTYLQVTGRQLKNEFQNELLKRARQLSKRMQADLDSSVDRGPVPFTHRAILFTYKKKNAQSVSCSILVKDLQAKYLYDVLIKPNNIKKFVNTSAARLTKQGNIAGLKTGLSTGKFKIVKSKNGKERLIDTSKKDTKKKTKRVIGLRESKKRKLIYDFYKEAEKGTRLVLNNIEGSFVIRKG